jgi:hypothetical protein
MAYDRAAIFSADPAPMELSEAEVQQIMNPPVTHVGPPPLVSIHDLARIGLGVALAFGAYYGLGEIIHHRGR